jgi:hypothetical protein
MINEGLLDLLTDALDSQIRDDSLLVVIDHELCRPFDDVLHDILHLKHRVQKIWLTRGVIFFVDIVES